MDITGSLSAIGYGLAAIGGGIGVGLIFAAYMTSVARQPESQRVLQPMLFLGFAVKVPIVPLHNWLPDAHVEAPTAGSVILAAIALVSLLGIVAGIRAGRKWILPVFLGWIASFASCNARLA